MKQWYAISVSTGYEKKVKELLDNRVKNEKLEDIISNIFLPETEVTSKTGKKSIKNMYPGYMFIEMDMTDDAWYIIRNTTNVTGFVGSSGKGAKPFPVERENIENIFKMINKNVAEEKGVEEVEVDFIIGDKVEVVNGPSKGTISLVKNINFDRGECEIEMEMLGRKVPTTVSISDVVKI